MKRFATESGTRDWLKSHNFHPDAIRLLGTTKLSVSSVGFGTYRVDARDSHRNALLSAIVAGSNVIDTSSNYMQGASEHCIGEVLKQAEAQGATRDVLVIVTKAGYVQGPNMAMAREAEQRGRPFPDMVKYDDHCWHCIHPEFLRVQLEMSQERMGTSPDVFLLHNPEYFFMAQPADGDLRELRLIFYERIRAAFAFLEEAVAKGEIASYGVSSNTFAHAPEHAHATSVIRMLAIAEKVAGAGHHFRVAQLPFNLFEHGAATQPLGDGKCFLDIAREADLGVLVNRPLNAIRGQHLIRLADAVPPSEVMSFGAELHELIALEEEFLGKISPLLASEQHRGKPLFVWGAELSRFDPARIESAEIDRIEQDYVRPQVRELFQWVEGQLSGEDDLTTWALWRNRYWPKILQTMQVARLENQRARYVETQKVRALLAPFVPRGWGDDSLSRLSVALLAATPGVSSVLVGMRSKAYVDDVLPILKRAAPEFAPKIFGRLNAYR